MEAMLLWGLGLLAVAVLLLVVDIFMPTAGVLIVTSLTVAIAGVVCLFQYSAVWGLIGTLAVIVGGPVLLFLGLNIMPNTPIGRRLVLSNPDQEDDDRPPAPSRNELSGLVGKEGLVLSDLRPVGVIRIGDRRFDALSETSLVRAGARVRVTAVEGSELRVREVT